MLLSAMSRKIEHLGLNIPHVNASIQNNIVVLAVSRRNGAYLVQTAVAPKMGE